MVEFLGLHKCGSKSEKAVVYFGCIRENQFLIILMSGVRGISHSHNFDITVSLLALPFSSQA